MENLNVLKNLNKDDIILVKSVIDKYKKYEKTGISTYTNFLDIRKYKIVSNALNRLDIKFNTYKANLECEKSIIYFGEYEDFVTIYSFINEEIRHKDVLGTLFSIGYDIDTIGDIFVSSDKVYITNLSRLNKYLEDNLCMINKKYIKLNIENEIILNEDRFINFNIVIPSYRIDVIVSKIAHMSRSDAIKYINDKMVHLNYEEVSNVNKIVNIGDTISIRKYGKYILDKELKKSRKDNYFVEVKKYN